MRLGYRAGLLLAGSAIALASAASAGETVTYTYDALGRLTATISSGTVNNGTATGIAYDPAGNRTASSVGSVGGTPPSPPPSPPGPPGPPPPPAPPPPPPPSGNQPPVANADTAPSIPRCGSTSVDVLANDSDPENNVPLAVTGVAGGAGLSLTIVGAGTIAIQSLGPSGLKTFSYTVRDSLNASSTGSVAVTVTNVNTCP